MPEQTPPNLVSIDSSLEYVLRNVVAADEWLEEEEATPRGLIAKDGMILFASGESLFIAADTGHGKSTNGQNIMLVLIGLKSDYLGMTSSRVFTRVLYIAADRPNQIRASMQRFINRANRQIWHERVMVQKKALDFKIDKKEGGLLSFCKIVGQSKWGVEPELVIIDSLKDAVSTMDDNDAGISINRELQSLCQNGIEVMVLAHLRKLQTKDGLTKPPVLDDIAGNKNILAGAGSVLYIAAPDAQGKSQIHHLKSPAQEVETQYISLDKITGFIDKAS